MVDDWDSPVVRLKLHRAKLLRNSRPSPQSPCPFAAGRTAMLSTGLLQNWVPANSRRWRDLPSEALEQLGKAGSASPGRCAEVGTNSLCRLPSYTRRVWGCPCCRDRQPLLLAFAAR